MRAWSLLLVALLGLALPTTALPLPVATHSESFETGWGPWAADHQVQCEDDGTCTLDWSLERFQGVARSGTWSLENHINGILDDGVVWAEAPLLATPGTPVPVSITFHVLSEVHSDVNNWGVVAYLGEEDPEREDDFTVVGQTDQGAGWRTFCHAAVVTPDADGKVWAAFGISVTWETPRTYYLDDVAVGIGEASADCAEGPLCLWVDLPVCGVGEDP
ncbi:MAG: hypothetical protein KY455_03030 [Euryarchaeota archaeon]|nr:hypothetical protein [Euryarchaeota archaeon]